MTNGTIEQQNNVFQWTQAQSDAAVMLATGTPKKHIIEQLGIARTTLWNWEQNPVFSIEVDKLSLMHGLASKAYRMRMIQEAVKSFKNKDDSWNTTGTTLLEWIKEARMQMEGVSLNIVSQLATFIEQTGLVDGAGPASSIQAIEAQTDETD